MNLQEFVGPIDGSEAAVCICKAACTLFIFFRLVPGYVHRRRRPERTHSMTIGNESDQAGRKNCETSGMTRGTMQKNVRLRFCCVQFSDFWWLFCFQLLGGRRMKRNCN